MYNTHIAIYYMMETKHLLYIAVHIEALLCEVHIEALLCEVLSPHLPPPCAVPIMRSINNNCTQTSSNRRNTYSSRDIVALSC